MERLDGNIAVFVRVPFFGGTSNESQPFKTLKSGMKNERNDAKKRVSTIFYKMGYIGFGHLSHGHLYLH